MNIIVIGLGSMGRRRIRLIKRCLPDAKIIGIDRSEERREQAADELSVLTTDSIDASEVTEYLRGSIDAAFVCSPPLTHGSIILDLINRDINTFTELNLVSDGYDDIIAAKNDKGIFLFMSSTLLYRNDIQYIANKTNKSTVNYFYHVGQYLPDWHPWENYSDFFVGDARTNGCREIFAIELPWITRAFGDIEKMDVCNSNISGLNINYPDNYLITMHHKNGTRGQFAVDVVSQKPVRRLEVMSEGIHIFWDGSPDSLYSLDLYSGALVKVDTYKDIEKDTNYSDNIIENAYAEEMLTFFDCIRGIHERSIRYTIEDDSDVLKLIDEIEGIV